MNKSLSLVLAITALFLGSVQAAEKKSHVYDKFYGKITTVNLETNKMTVFNKSKKLESRFTLASNIKVIQKKKMIPKSGLKAGQSLIVYYTLNGADQRVAERITVRAPYKRKKKTETIQ